MSRYDLRKRKQPSGEVVAFISAKRRKIDEGDDISSGKDPDYVREEKMEIDDVVIYDEEDKESETKDPPVKSLKFSFSKSSEEKDSEESSEEGSSDDSSEGESLDDSSEEEGSESLENSEESSSFEPKKSEFDYEEIVDKVAKNLIKRRSKDLDHSDFEKLAKTELDRANKLRKIAEAIQADLEAEEPDIVKILSTPMTRTDCKKMVQLYEIYKNTLEYTPEHLELRTKIIDMLKGLSRVNVSENERVEREVERIMDTVPKTDIIELRRRIIDLNTDDIIKARLLEMYRELEETSIESTQYRNLKDKIEWGVSLPYKTVSEVKVPLTPDEMNKYCIDLRKKLDQEIYGMDEVKEEMIALRVNQLTNPGARSTLGLEGPPGVGKTAICELFAKAVGKPFQRIACGGMENVYLLKGSDNHFVGSAPSILLSFLREMKIADGYVLVDEIDKLKQDVQDALLHITDYTQNKEFRDTFLSEFPHDLSKICFMYGMNDKNKINPILRDRLEIVEVEAYTRDQLKNIIKGYLLRRALIATGLVSKSESDPPLVTIDDSGCDAILGMLASHIQESGVRKIDEAVRKIVTRINLLRMVTLKDGSTGKLKLKYTIPNFSLPFNIDRNAVKQLLPGPKHKTVSYIL